MNGKIGYSVSGAPEHLCCLSLPSGHAQMPAGTSRSVSILGGPLCARPVGLRLSVVGAAGRWS